MTQEEMRELFYTLPSAHDGNPYYREMSLEAFTEVLDKVILAERERCVRILMTRHENHPQDGEQWDGTFYDLAEEIIRDPQV